ncbi:hypothetical protein [Dyella japonica]|uniref:IS5 family transposase n=1 Tax=Dyella japonica TaxID=231455 RepID=A0ABV2K1U4_9GAMM
MTKYVDYLTGAVRAKLEHPFQVIRRQFGCQAARVNGLTKKHGVAVDAVALFSLCVTRRRLLAMAGELDL